VVDADDDATVVTPRGTENDWNARAYQPPQAYVPSVTKIKRRRAWPWVVGILGAFLLGIVVIAIAGAFLAPRLIRRAQQQANNTPPPARSNTNTNSNTAEANTNSTEHVDTPPPTDHDKVLAELTDLENEWTVANVNADKKKLDRILADDYAGQGAQGELQSKADYLRDISRDTSIEKWEFGDLTLKLTGDRATLTGTVTLFGGNRKRVLNFVDKFVWRDGRWQATGSAVNETDGSELVF
jgi:hypothetical protein